jgi:N-acyl-phosphatidylethanolamine-hydrolysing phospholipase D
MTPAPFQAQSPLARQLLGAKCVEKLNELSLDQRHHGDGVFVNPWPSFVSRTGGDAFSMFALGQGFQKVDYDPPQGLPPVQEPTYAQIYAPPVDGRPQLTWLGHASFLLQMDGFNVLTDPLFTHRCSPFSWVGPSRFTPLPPHVDRPDALPQIHLVIISHNHYDHTSTATINFLHSSGMVVSHVTSS